MTGSILSYQQKDPIRLQCKIDLKKLFSSPKEREQFNKKWKDFLESDPYNKEIFELKGDLLKYQSEQLIPSKPDNRPHLLLILGNPASHSVKEGMFFSFERDKKEHRFWKIMRNSRVLDLPIESHLSIKEQNNRRKRHLLELQYESPFRIGLCVYISIPSASSKKRNIHSSKDFSGVSGIQKLIGSKAMRRLEEAENKRVLECSKKFLSPNGVAVAFQKNAWNALRSDKDPEYKLGLAKDGKLKGTLKDMKNVPLLGVPPTRRSGPCSHILCQLLEEEDYSLLKNTI